MVRVVSRKDGKTKRKNAACLVVRYQARATARPAGGRGDAGASPRPPPPRILLVTMITNNWRVAHVVVANKQMPQRQQNHHRANRRILVPGEAAV